MSKTNLKPFNSMSDLLREALQSAIAYDLDLIDCGGWLDDKRGEIKAKSKILAYRRLLDCVTGDGRTQQEKFSDYLKHILDAGGAKMMTIDEIKKARDRNNLS